MTVVLQVICDW